MNARAFRIAVIAGVTAAIVSVGVGALVARSQPKALTWHSLVNATYPVSLRPNGVTLHEGLFEAAAAPGSASKILVRIADVAAFGDIDGMGDLDAAVVLVSSGGGTGTFVELAAVVNDAGSAHPVASALLGDRVLVREVRVSDRSILVRMRSRGATDPLTLRTHEILRRYALDGGKLVLRDETEADVQSAPAADFVYRTERIDVPVGSSREVSGSLAPGQIGSYVVHAGAGQTLDLTLRSEFDNAVLSVFGLSDGVQLVSRRDYVVERSVQVGVDQDYAVKVVSLAGQQLPYTLRVGLRASAQPVASPSPTSEPLPSRTPSPTRPPTSFDERPLSAASDAAAAFASTRPPIVGVAVYVPSRGIVFTLNADAQVPTASVVKVLVLLTVLEQARQEGRPVAESDLALLWPMITESDNDATSELWERIGRGQAVAAYLAAIGVTGFTPDPGTSWGVSFVSARAMATVLGKLLAGEILDDPSRALAIRMLDDVVAEQRWGVTAGTDEAGGDKVAIKNGWYPGDEGWRVNSVGIVRPRTGAAYAIGVVTDARPSWNEGITTIEGIAGPVNERMRQVGFVARSASAG